MLPLGGVELADAGLDGDAQLREGGENLTEQAVKLVGEGEQTGALALARHRPGGAAEVEVHLAIAACVQLAGAPDEVLAAVCQNLRHDREPLVVRGLDLVALLRWKLWFAFGERKGVKYLSAPPKSSWWTRRQSQPVSPSIGAA